VTFANRAKVSRFEVEDFTDSKGHSSFVPREAYFAHGPQAILNFRASLLQNSVLLILKDIPASFLEKRTLRILRAAGWKGSPFPRCCACLCNASYN